MTLEAYCVLALYTLAIWFVTDHVLNHNTRDTWEQYPDLGAVDLNERHRNRVAQEADDARLVNEGSGFAHARIDRRDLRTRLHEDIVTRRERMRNHPQRVPWHL